MTNLYIDFDGVIADTIKVTYNMMKEQHIEHSDQDAVRKFYCELDWRKLLKTTPLINDSMNSIKRIIETNRFDVAILTHVCTMEEAIAKVKFIRKYLPHITIIPVPKEISKTQMVNPKNSILIDDYAGNLRSWEVLGGIGVRFSLELEGKGFRVINKLDQILEMAIIND